MRNILKTSVAVACILAYFALFYTRLFTELPTYMARISYYGMAITPLGLVGLAVLSWTLCEIRDDWRERKTRNLDVVLALKYIFLVSLLERTLLQWGFVWPGS